ncbi:MAG: ATP-binding protein [Archangium sp.]|nr:ATP-binding protein [Archangium sp.]
MRALLFARDSFVRLLSGSEELLEDHRPRFVREAHSIGVVVACLMVAAYVALHEPISALLTTAITFSVISNRALLWLGASAASVARGTLAVILLAFAGFSVAESPFDSSMYLWFALVPFVATSMLGSSAGWRWGVLTMFVMVAARLTSAQGWIAPTVHHTTSVVSELRALAVGVTLVLFVIRFDADRRASLIAAQSADRLKSHFLANMSHEIRTPMNGILGMAQALLRGPMEASQREALEVIERSGQTLVSLLNDLLDISKIEAGKFASELRDFDPARAVRDVGVLFEALARERGVAFEVRLPEGLPALVRGDEHRLQQVLRNLVSNAVKFTEQGSVWLEVAQRPGLLRFDVVDTGKGMAPDVTGRLFHSFEQGDPSISRRFGGTGLGLALSQRLVGFMGGTLAVQSVEGQGSRFSFEVPLPSVEARVPPSQVGSGPPVAQAAVDGARVLVVDDNDINRMVAAALVRKAGFPVECVGGGQEAIAAVSRERFVLVLMDFHMPDVDGLAATRAIRAMEGPAGRTRIVALTASAMPEELIACREAGMDDTLVKPLLFEQLVEVLESARRAARQPPAA